MNTQSAPVRARHHRSARSTRRRRWPSFRLLLALLILLAAPSVCAAPEVLRASLESPYVLSTGDGTAYLGILIEPLSSAKARSRQPVSLSLIVDTSNSMRTEQKIENARMAATAIIAALAPDDEMALVDFDSVATVVHPLARIGTDRAALKAGVERLISSGGTHIATGLQVGLGALKGAHGPRKALLISDGQATEGPTTAEGILDALTPNPAGGPVTLSAIGVGLNYDEGALSAFATRFGGRFHHLADAEQLAAILADELERSRQVVGTGAQLWISPRPGVELIAAAGLELHRAADGTVRIDVGELLEAEVRSITVKIKVSTEGTGGRVATIAMRYLPVDGSPVVHREISPGYVLTPSSKVVETHQIGAYMVAADRMRVVHVLVDAAALLQAGDLLEAQAILRDERTRLQSRFGRLEGPARAEALGLIALFDDPYVDTDFSAKAAAQPRGDLELAVGRVRRGERVGSSLRGLDKAQLRIVRNTAYARHGYRFKSSDLRRYFGAKGWYRASPKYAARLLSRADGHNIAAVKALERAAGLARGSRRRRSKQAGPTFDKLLRAARLGKRVGDVEGMDLKQLRLLRNAAYARHGYRFRSSDLRTFFGAKRWYAVDSAYSPARLDTVDSENVRRIKSREQALLAGGKAAIRDFQLRSRAKANQATR